MLGAIAGDIIGSVYEPAPIKTKKFPLFDSSCRFTDDTVLSVAIAEAIVRQVPYRDTLRHYGLQYPNAGYGASFYRWLRSNDAKPYGSWGNGAAMRVSPIGFAYHTEEEVLSQARMSAEITHNHPEGIKGAQAVALAIFLARKGVDKNLIKRELIRCFGYDLNRTIDQIRPGYRFDISCQGTVPEAIISFLEADSFQDAIRNSISLGGDSDTLACITGSIAEAYYKSVPEDIAGRVRELLPPDLWKTVVSFYRYIGRPLP